MKTYFKQIYMLAALAGATLGLTGCGEDFSQPPLPIVEEGGDPGIYVRVGQDRDPEDADYNPNIGKIGQGTWECPLTVYQARIGTKPAGMTDNVWVCGYIVGWVNSGESLVMQQSNCVFQAPASTSSNILISDFSPAELEELFVEKEYERDSAGELTGRYTVVSDTRWEHCCPVDLVYDTDPRSALGLTAANANNLGKIVSVMGETNLKKYGVFGVKFTSAYVWGCQGKEIAPAQLENFKRVAAFTPDNWYMIAADYQNSWHAAKNMEATRDYLKTGSVMASAGLVTDADFRTYAFYFETAENGCVRIREANGLYLCTDGTDIAFHTTDEPAKPECLFTVEEEGDGPFIIKSKANGSRMMYDTGYGSYGLYKTITAAHVAPSMFILVK